MTKTGNQGARVDVYRGGEDTPDNTRDFLGIRNQITIIRGVFGNKFHCWIFPPLFPIKQHLLTATNSEILKEMIACLN